MWKNIVQPDKACGTTKATNTYSEYVIIIALTLQQWLHERASLLRYI